LRTQSTVLNALGIQFHSAIGKVESLLDDRSQLTDATVVFSQDILRASGTDDQLGAVRSGADFDTSVAVLKEYL
jgi:hypothetical protein